MVRTLGLYPSEHLIYAKSQFESVRAYQYIKQYRTNAIVFNIGVVQLVKRKVIGFYYFFQKIAGNTRDAV